MIKKALSLLTVVAVFFTAHPFAASADNSTTDQNTQGITAMEGAELSSSPAVLAASTPQEEPITRGAAADMILQAAGKYTPGLVRGDILKGYGDGSLNEDAAVTRAEAFVMVSRAFGTLAAPIGYMEKISPVGVSFSDLPDWAAEDIQNLTRAGVLVGAEVGILAPEEPLTREQLTRLLYRLYAYKGSDLKDDFYISSNKEVMDGLALPAGAEAAGGSSALASKTAEQVKEIIKEIVEAGADYPNGSDEQKIRDLYCTLADMETRNRLGIQPLEKYFDKVDGAEKLSELALVQAEIVQELGKDTNGLLLFFERSDANDQTNIVLSVVPGLGLLGPAKEYEKILQEKLQLTGVPADTAASLTAQLISLDGGEADEPSITLPEGDTLEGKLDDGSMDGLYFYTLEEVDRLAPELGIADMLQTLGYGDAIKFQAVDKNGFEQTLKNLNNENLDALKAQVKLALLDFYHEFLSQEIIDFYQEAEERLGYGSGGEAETPEERAYQAVANYLSDPVGRQYAARHFTPEAKADVKVMIDELIAAFEARVQKLDWMSDETKGEALRKLETLKVAVGYPDEWPEENLEIKSPEEGGSAFQNMAAVFSAETLHDFSSLQVYTVNAAANRQTNQLIFPAGIMQAPYYDVNATREENLAGIGAIIAHEITHVFDDQGAKYDADGNLRDWWKPEEHAYFQELCQKAVEFYDGWEAAPGIAADGANTLSENIADIGGMACTLDVLKQIKNPDYDQFFRAHSAAWVKVTTRALMEENIYDEHAPNNLRINRVFSNFQEFFDTYAIGEGDGMYVAPEDRILIW